MTIHKSFTIFTNTVTSFIKGYITTSKNVSKRSLQLTSNMSLSAVPVCVPVNTLLLCFQFVLSS